MYNVICRGIEIVMRNFLNARLDKFNKKLILCIIINLCYFTILMQIFEPYLQNTDDHLMGMLLMGGKGTATPDIVFVNIILSEIIYFFSCFIPVVNWLAVFEVGLVLLCFIVLSYIVLIRTDNVWFTIAIVLIFAPFWYMRLTFSTAAIIGGTAGFLLLLYSFENKNITNTILAIIIIIYSYMLRSVAISGVLPIFLFFIIKKVIKNKKDIKYYCITFACMFLSLFSVIVINKIYYNDWNENYKEFNSARAAVIDYSLADYEDVQEELDDIGVSENDYALIKARVFDDYDFFSSELLNEIAEISKNTTSVKSRMFNTINNYFQVWKESCFYMVLIVSCILLILYGDFHYLIDVLYINAVLQSYVIYLNCIVGRFPIYIKNGLCFAALGALFYACSTYEKKLIYNVQQKKIIAYIICTFILFLNINDMLINNRDSSYKQQDARVFMDTISKEDNFYFLDFVAKSEWLYCRNVSVFERIPSDYYKNILRFSNWDRYLEQTDEQLFNAGIESPFESLLNDNVYLLSNESGNMELLRTYFNEHFGINCSYSLIAEDVAQGINVYKFTDNLSNIGLENGNIEVLKTCDEDSYKKILMLISVDDDSKYYLELTDSKKNRYTYLAVDDSKWYEVGENVYAVEFIVPKCDITVGENYKIKIIEKKSDESCYYINDKKIVGF